MLTGLMLLLAAGAMNGSFAVPGKRIRGWGWEHGWLLWSITGLIVVPWGAMLATVSRPLEVYGNASFQSLALVAAFGLAWGIAAVLFGLGVTRLGVGIGFALILGISSVVGAAGPLLLQDTAKLSRSSAWITVAGMAVQLAGIACCGVAGSIRDRERRQGGVRLWSGLIICILSGLGSPMVNFGLAFGSGLRGSAMASGTLPSHAVNAIWPVLFGGAFLINAGYCAWLISRSSSWAAFRARFAGSNSVLGLLMGVLWMASNLSYGYGSGALGPAGIGLGWPIMMGTTVLTANAWGIAPGEWKGSPRRSRLWMAAGTATLMAGVSMIGLASAA